MTIFNLLLHCYFKLLVLLPLAHVGIILILFCHGFTDGDTPARDISFLHSQVDDRHTSVWFCAGHD